MGNKVTFDKLTTCLGCARPSPWDRLKGLSGREWMDSRKAYTSSHIISTVCRSFHFDLHRCVVQTCRTHSGFHPIARIIPVNKLAGREGDKYKYIFATVLGLYSKVVNKHYRQNKQTKTTQKVALEQFYDTLDEHSSQSSGATVLICLKFRTIPI